MFACSQQWWRGSARGDLLKCQTQWPQDRTWLYIPSQISLTWWGESIGLNADSLQHLYNAPTEVQLLQSPLSLPSSFILPFHMLTGIMRQPAKSLWATMTYQAFRCSTRSKMQLWCSVASSQYFVIAVSRHVLLLLDLLLLSATVLSVASHIMIWMSCVKLRRGRNGHKNSLQ